VPPSPCGASPSRTLPGRTTAHSSPGTHALQIPVPILKETYKGVRKHANKWSAYTYASGRQVPIGHCTTPEDAAVAYDRYLIARYGAVEARKRGLNFDNLWRSPHVKPASLRHVTEYDSMTLLVPGQVVHNEQNAFRVMDNTFDPLDQGENTSIGPLRGEYELSGASRFLTQPRNGYKGVRSTKDGVYIAYTYRSGAQQSIGAFPSAERAAREYDKAVVNSRGLQWSLSRGLNFPELFLQDVDTGDAEVRRRAGLDKVERLADSGIIDAVAAVAGPSAAALAQPVFKGVRSNKSGRWSAYSYKDGKQKFLGGFETEVEAARAYDKFNVDEKGLEDARRRGMNLPDEWTTGQWIHNPANDTLASGMPAAGPATSQPASAAGDEGELAEVAALQAGPGVEDRSGGAGAGPSVPENPPKSSGNRKRKVQGASEPPTALVAMSPSRIVLSSGARRPAEQPSAPPPMKRGRADGPGKAKGGRDKQAQATPPPARVPAGTRVSARQAGRAVRQDPVEGVSPAEGWGVPPIVVPGLAPGPGVMPLALDPWASVPQPGVAPPLGYSVAAQQGLGWGGAAPGDVAMAMQHHTMALQMQRAVTHMAQHGALTSAAPGQNIDPMSGTHDEEQPKASGRGGAGPPAGAK